MLTTDASADADTGPRMLERHRVAVLVPCCNEAATIAGVVAAFGAALPGSVVYVYDNSSTDRTVDTVTRGRREMKLLAYLRHGAPGEPEQD